MTLGELQQNLNKFNIRDEVNEVLNETRADLKTLNQGQLFIGMKSDGGFLPDYSAVSVQKFGKPAGPIRLYETGAFWRSIQVDIESGKIVFTADDSKTSMLLTRFGKNILGLSNKSKKEEYVPLYFIPGLKKRIESKTGLQCV